MVQLQGPLKIENEKIGIQCGRTLLTFSVRGDKMKEEKVSNEKMIEEEIKGMEEQYKGIESFSKLVQMSIRATQSHRKPPSQKQKVQNLLRKRDIRDGGSEGTVDVEETTPIMNNKQLHSRSKKINKRSARSPSK